MTDEQARALAALVRETGRAPDLTTDHGRWQLYEASYGSLDLLHVALAHEQDAALRTSVVLRVLELVEDHTRWLELAPGDEYAPRRSREVGVLRRAADLPAEEVDLPAWSDWLQLRLAEVPARGLLRVLAEQGRTRRIRRVAAGTLAGL